MMRVPEHDTVRIVVDWKCNLKCSYCCNERPDIQAQFVEKELSQINFDNYKNVCISGGEPLLFKDRILDICSLLTNQYVILYSNGIYMTEQTAKELDENGVHAINIGLHYPTSFDKIISNVLEFTKDTNLSIRFHVWEKYQELELEKKFNATIKYWVMDDCDRINEDRVVLKIN